MEPKKGQRLTQLTRHKGRAGPDRARDPENFYLTSLGDPFKNDEILRSISSRKQRYMKMSILLKGSWLPLMSVQQSTEGCP